MNFRIKYCFLTEVNMTEKKRNPKVNLPGFYKDVSMMMAVRNGGKVNRNLIKMFCSAVHTFETRKNENFRKMNKDLGGDE